jgi:hypothetical protein
MAVAEPQPIDRRHLRPAAAGDDRLVAADCCAVVSTVDGDSVGSEAPGIWMVREALSKS